MRQFSIPKIQRISMIPFPIVRRKFEFKNRWGLNLCHMNSQQVSLFSWVPKWSWASCFQRKRYTFERPWFSTHDAWQLNVNPPKSDPNDYEKILSELDANIQKAEVRLSEIKIRERRTGVLWILYSSITWAVFLLYSFVTLHGESDVAWETASVTILPVIIIPFG